MLLPNHHKDLKEVATEEGDRTSARVTQAHCRKKCLNSEDDSDDSGDENEKAEEEDRGNAEPDRQVVVDVPGGEENEERRKKKSSKKLVSQLKIAYCEFYRGLLLLAGFCTLNTEGFSKILKKYDKKFATRTKEAFFHTTLEPKTQFFRHSELNILVEETEYSFCEAFEKGNRHEAMKLLRLPQKKPKQWMTFRVGMFLGISIVLLTIVIYWLATTHAKGDQGGDILAFAAYRMVGLVILLVWMWGADMYVWSHNRIDHVLIFDFDPRNHHQYHTMLEGASILTSLWLLFVLAYVVAHNGADTPLWWLGRMDPRFYPLIFVVASLLVFVAFQIMSQFWLVKTLIVIACTPFRKISFKDNFMADQLNSLSIIFFDVEHVACFYIYDMWAKDDACSQYKLLVKGIIVCVPPMWRCLQCLRQAKVTHNKWQLVNAGKYVTSICVSATSAIHGTFAASIPLLVVWVIFAVLGSCYNYIWDVYWDWGLARNWCKKPLLLRTTLLFKRRWVYYIVVFADFAMRMMWTLTISPTTLGIGSPIQNEILTSVVACLEILRRGVWNVYRVENEHLSNCAKYRVTRNIELVSVED
eukprot:TRINITY_DN43_c0_g2_i1.p1 TRINITY_DN43_c0_g2~~TRINITY_DN43_c0_g2_i1.p1  ORF type:complete len:584 (+),score=143.95 TRINITY_DN43_c0_g2_i1:866-2617(+)